MSKPTRYIITQDQWCAVFGLSAAVLRLSPKAVSKDLRAIAEDVKSIAAHLPELEPVEVTGCKLESGQECVFCGGVGAEKKKAEPKRKRTVCPKCEQPFTRATPWRLLRGKRIHNACL